MGSNVAQLFKELDDVDRQESVFLLSVAYLRLIRVSLERFRLALDFAYPLGSIDSAESVVFGVVESVTAVRLFAVLNLQLPT